MGQESGGVQALCVGAGWFTRDSSKGTAGAKRSKRMVFRAAEKSKGEDGVATGSMVLSMRCRRDAVLGYGAERLAVSEDRCEALDG